MQTFLVLKFSSVVQSLSYFCNSLFPFSFAHFSNSIYSQFLYFFRYLLSVSNLENTCLQRLLFNEWIKWNDENDHQERDAFSQLVIHEAHELTACYTFIFNEIRYSRLALSECLLDHDIDYIIYYIISKVRFRT